MCIKVQWCVLMQSRKRRVRVKYLAFLVVRGTVNGCYMDSHYVCVCVSLSTLQVFSILCGASCNLGAVRSIAIPLLKEALEPLGTTLINSLKPDWHDDAEATTYYHQ